MSMATTDTSTPQATRYRETCTQCGAIDGIAGSHAHNGDWWAINHIVDRFGFDFDKRDAWRDTLTAMPTEAQVADGVCAHCREVPKR